jgi:hypothetical protein
MTPPPYPFTPKLSLINWALEPSFKQSMVSSHGKSSKILTVLDGWPLKAHALGIFFALEALRVIRQQGV